MIIVLSFVSIVLVVWFVRSIVLSYKRFNRINLRYKNMFTPLSDIKEYAIRNNDKELLEEYYALKKYSRSINRNWFLMLLFSGLFILISGIILAALGWE